MESRNTILEYKNKCLADARKELEDDFPQIKKSFFSMFSTNPASGLAGFLSLQDANLDNLLKNLNAAFDRQIVGWQNKAKEEKDNKMVLISKQQKIYEENMQIIKRNFVRNTKKILERVKRDADILKKGFLADMVEPKLVEIKSSGSDFHKSGSQVHFLIFKDKNNKIKKVVYKPSSIQADAMLIGNIHQLKTIDPSYEKQSSMAEIINTSLKDSVAKMPTYMVMPLTDKGEIPARADYGYIEFVTQEGGFDVDDNDFADEANGQVSLIAKYKKHLLELANSDKKSSYILKTPEEQQAFSYQCGLTTAVAAVVSAGDFHNENVIIAGQRMVLIDVEAIFNPTLMPLCNDALIFNPLDMERSSLSPISKGTDQASNVSYPERNLVYYIDNGMLRPFVVDEAAFMKGYSHVMNLLSAEESLLMQWFRQQKVREIRTRFIPVSTSDYLRDITWQRRNGFRQQEFEDECKKKAEKASTAFNSEVKDVIERNTKRNNAEFRNDLTKQNIPPDIYINMPALPIPRHLLYSNSKALLDEYRTDSVPFYYMEIRSTTLRDWNGDEVKLDDVTRKQMHELTKMGVDVGRSGGPEGFFLIAPLELITNRADLIANDEKIREILIADTRSKLVHIREKANCKEYNSFVSDGIPIKAPAAALAKRN